MVRLDDKRLHRLNRQLIHIKAGSGSTPDRRARKNGDFRMIPAGRRGYDGWFTLFFPARAQLPWNG
jgi:hypothetical protein